MLKIQLQIWLKIKLSNRKSYSIQFLIPVPFYLHCFLHRTDFDWLKMLRYYWNPDTELMLAKMASACLPYFYEYLGAGGVLVITPLTDR